MNIIDLLLSIFLLLGLVRGLFKGFLVELAGLVALVGGIYAAIHFSDAAYGLFDIFLDWEEKYLAILAFAFTFFIVAFLISLAGKFLTKMAHIVALGLVNRLLGGIFGMVKMAFLASLFFMLFDYFGYFQPDEETKENSVLYLPVRAMAPIILPRIIEEVKEGDTFITPSEAEEMK
ncbi:CvpA family protein [Salinimicrobium soli]|uniref:CvpA family protein n=1 Tax=Salinimicrobium soli TaxID=1254399 RepID=UPI003AAEAD78